MKRPIVELSQSDIQQILELEKTPEQVLEQLDAFRAGFPFVRLKRPCVLRDGVSPLPDEEAARRMERFRPQVDAGRVMKFVPASGAASRMFKPFFALRKKIRDGQEIPRHQMDLMSSLPQFAFFEELRRAMQRHGQTLDSRIGPASYRRVLDCLLGERGLNYAHLPKGLILFHRYPEGARTAFEEHFVEAVHYVRDREGKAWLHFTVPHDFKSAVTEHMDRAKRRFAALDTDFEVGLSVQSRSTDTIAVDLRGRPFRTRNGRLLFRPGGHGALLRNLSDLKADIVFVKNVDNVVPDWAKGETGLFKQALGGILVELQERVFEFLRAMEDSPPTRGQIEAVQEFAERDLNLRFPPGFVNWSLEERRHRLFNKLNRPLRVCGVVQNLGEPGGGPFWVSEPDGSESLQIVELHQVDHEDHDQHAIWRSSEFFNPVDVVCAVRDCWGKPFNLMEYRDPETAFVSTKSYGGRELKALELPGLWNGSMARWTTVFVEVPVSTFNPVKSVVDLLRPEHQTVRV